nr:copia protein [Tanacetum cinerariifolium]
MQEELLQFSLQKGWRLVDPPYGKKDIRTKWVYRNKKDETGIIVRNKARLEAQGHRKEEGIDYDEVFAPVAQIEVIKIFLAFASFMGFIVYQMDVKSAFLYGIIEEVVYVSQPLSFIDRQFSNKVYKVEKALYGLHQAPRAWYETLSTFLLQNGYRRGTINKTLFIKKDKDDIMLVQVYIDDIIIGSTKKSLYDEFEALMHKRFQMSSIGELTFFLGLQESSKLERIEDIDADDNITLVNDQEMFDADRDLQDITTADIEETISTATPITTVVTDDELTMAQALMKIKKSKPKGLRQEELLSMSCEALSKEISISILCLIHTAKTFDLVWIWLGGDYGNVFINGFSWDSVLNMCRNYLHGSLSEQRTHEFMHIYVATASVPILACCGGLVDSGLQERYGLIEIEEGVAGK